MTAQSIVSCSSDKDSSLHSTMHENVCDFDYLCLASQSANMVCNASLDWIEIDPMENMYPMNQYPWSKLRSLV